MKDALSQYANMKSVAAVIHIKINNKITSGKTNSATALENTKK
jgi:hypothetical protein